MGKDANRKKKIFFQKIPKIKNCLRHLCWWYNARTREGAAEGSFCLLSLRIVKQGPSRPQNHAKGLKRILLMKYMYKSCMSALVITAFGHRVNHTSEANGNKAGVEFERCFVDFREMEFNCFAVGHSLWECRTDHYIILPFGLEGLERARVHQAKSEEMNSQDTWLEITQMCLHRSVGKQTVVHPKPQESTQQQEEMSQHGWTSYALH